MPNRSRDWFARAEHDLEQAIEYARSVLDCIRKALADA